MRGGGSRSWYHTRDAGDGPTQAGGWLTAEQGVDLTSRVSAAAAAGARAHRGEAVCSEYCVS